MRHDFSWEPNGNRPIVFYQNEFLIELRFDPADYQNHIRFNDWLDTWYIILEDIINGEYSESELERILKMWKAKYKDYDYSDYKVGQMTIYDY